MTKYFWLSITLAACYGAAPPHPTTIPLPPVVTGAQLVVSSDTKTTVEDVPKRRWTCPAGVSEGSPECIVTRWSEREPVTRTTSTMTYADKPIDAAQFTVMTDPDYDKKVDDLDRLSKRCHAAHNYALAGFGLLVAGPLVWAEGASAGSSVTVDIGLGVIAAGFASWAYGYWAKGGNHCDEANMLYGRLEAARSGMGQMSITGNADELHEAARHFNQAIKVAR